MQNLISELSKASKNLSPDKTGTPGTRSTVGSLSEMIPGGLVGGAAAGGVVALLLGGKSSRKMVKKVVKYGGTAVMGGLAYKAYQNWQHNKALGQSEPVSDQDILTSAPEATHHANGLLIIKTMIAAAKADGVMDSAEHKKLHNAIEESGLGDQEKLTVFELMSRDVSVQEIADSVTNDDQRAEVYLAAYLAIEVDEQRERAFLNDLSIALNLPKGFAAYLEQQADQGVQS